VITVHGRPSVRIVSYEEDVPERPDRNGHQMLDTIKHKISCEVLARFPIKEIKRRSLSNIERWRSKGTFGQAYADWLEILTDPDDSKLISAMVGNSDRSNQLRQSIPFVGMLDQEIVRKFNEEIRMQYPGD
jgi:antitoxin (DNA-binding transcriptional repressor) of toxin-antitoxin stability system